jgi:hypothetical protein
VDVRERPTGSPRACNRLGDEILGIGVVLRQTPRHAVQRAEDREHLGLERFF